MLKPFLSRMITMLCIFSLIWGSLGCAIGKQTLSPRAGLGNTDYANLMNTQKRKSAINSSEADETFLPEMTAMDYEKRGDADLKRGNLDSAFIHYNKAQRMDRKNTLLHYKIGRLFLKKRMKKEARKEFEWILKKDQENVLALEGLGRVYFMEGNFEEAETNFRSALMKKPDLGEAHNFLGIIYDSRNNHEEAIKHYRNALWAKPKEPSSINNLALSYYLNGQYKEAVRTFETSIRNRSMNQRSYNNYALTLGATGQYDQALEMLKQSGDEAKAYNNLGMIFMKAGEHHRAKEAFAKAIDLSPTYFAKAYKNQKIAAQTIQKKKRSAIQQIRQLEADRAAAALQESAENHEVNQEIIVEDVVPQEKTEETVVDDQKIISDSKEVPSERDDPDEGEVEAVVAAESSEPEEVQIESEGAEEVAYEMPSVITEDQVAESKGINKGLVAGARVSLDKAPLYDPSYIKMSYPGGDPGWERGANTDLVVRAFRHTGIDLQVKVHEDIPNNVGFYGVEKPNTSIDHRRVKTLAAYFGRHAVIMGTDKDGDWQAGDLVIWDLDGGSKPNHIGIISDKMGSQGTPLVIHHRRKVDRFTGYPSEDDVLFAWPVVAHFRWQTSGVIADSNLVSLDTETQPVQVKEGEVEEMAPEAVPVPEEAAGLPEPATEHTGLMAAPVKEVEVVAAAPVLQERAEKIVDSAADSPVAETLVTGALLSVTKAPPYNASYKKISYPGGDPGWKRGGNSDLVVRAFRQAGVDLQQLIHEDIPEDPEAYKIEKRDPSADHRNVQTLYTFFSRKADSLGTDGTADWQPGDIVVWDLKGKGQPSHIGIVSDKTDPEGDPLVIHHRKKFGPSACYPSEDSLLFEWPIIGHYRWTGK